MTRLWKKIVTRLRKNVTMKLTEFTKNDKVAFVTARCMFGALSKRERSKHAAKTVAYIYLTSWIGRVRGMLGSAAN